MTQDRHPTTRRRMLGLTAAALAWPVTGRAAALETAGGAAFGTSWRIAGPDGAGLARLVAPFAALFAQIDHQMSPWREDSALSRFNRAGRGLHPLPGEMLHVAAAALTLAGTSGGAFDPTVGPLVARWGFGPIRDGGLPGPSALWPEGSGLVKDAAGATLDLCGIAKGRALDRAAALVRGLGHRAALIDLGGELTAIGRHPSGRDWQVAVEDGRGAAEPAAVMRLPDGLSVASSGQRHQSYLVGDRAYGHIIDPARAAPATGRLTAVSVLHPSAMMADGWATALFAAGAATGPALARRAGLSALFQIAGPDDGRPLLLSTGDFGGVLL